MEFGSIDSSTHQPSTQTARHVAFARQSVDEAVGRIAALLPHCLEKRHERRLDREPPRSLRLRRLHALLTSVPRAADAQRDVHEVDVLVPELAVLAVAKIGVDRNGHAPTPRQRNVFAGDELEELGRVEELLGALGSSIRSLHVTKRIVLSNAQTLDL